MSKNSFTTSLFNLPGWRTERKLVAIDSDDWGSIRLPSRHVKEVLYISGLNFDNQPYNRVDSLASSEDLTALFDTLSGISDCKGNSPIITANTIVANPDFEAIRASGFRDYFYEPFTRTLERYPEHNDSFRLWIEGIKAKIFRPQYHGLHHININRWMNSLCHESGIVRKAFDLGMFDLSTESWITENSFMDALNIKRLDEIPEIRKSISVGLNLFNELFGYRSMTFVAPSYIWHRRIETALKENGIKVIKGAHYQLEPIPGEAHKFNKIYHYTGQKTRAGLIYLTRNASFEPSLAPKYDWIREVLKSAESAFFWRKPLIISTHRLNFIGFIEKENRDKNLPKFKEMLISLLKTWPDLEFVSTEEIGKMIINGYDQEY